MSCPHIYTIYTNNVREFKTISIENQKEDMFNSISHVNDPAFFN